MQRYIRIATGLLIALLLGGAAIYYFNYAREPVYVVGVSLPLSGDQGDDGTQLLHAIQLMVDNVNDSGDLRGGRIKLLVKDDRNDPQEARKVAEELVKEKELLAVIGPYYASTLMGGAKDVYERNRVLMLAPYECNSDPKAASSWEFNMNYSDETGAGMMAIYLKEVLKKDKVLIIHNTDAYGVGSSKAFQEKAGRIGLNVHKVLTYDHYKKFGDDFIKTSLSADDIANIGSVVIFSHKASGVRLVRQLRQAGITSAIMGPHTFSSRKFLTELSEEESKDVFVASPFLYEISNEKAFQFREDFSLKYGVTPGSSAPLAADAVVLLAEAFRVKGADREALRSWLSSLDWENAIDGLTGNLFFSRVGNQMERDVFFSQIKDGRFKVAATQLTRPREPYVFKQLDDRVAKGYVRVIDETPYHIVDVVFVGLDFIKINDIDPRTMTFEAELFVWYKWSSNHVDINQIDFINIMQRKESYILKEYSRDDINYRCYRVKASFQMPFNLTRFPFDEQHLPIYIAHRNKNSTHLMLAMDTRHMDDSPVQDITPQEWTFMERTAATILYRFSSTFGDRDYRLTKGYKSKIYFSTVKSNIIVKRKVMPYIFNLFLPLAIILSISLLVLKIPVEQFMARMNASMTALMSILLYYLAQKATLPKVGYLMKSDYYFILAFAFILILQATNVFLVHVYIRNEQKEKAIKLNQKMALVLISGTIVAYMSITLFI